MPRGDDIELLLDDEPIAARRGEPVTSALMRAGHLVIGRSVKYHRPRGPFCLAGSCGACLVRVDGRPNLRACMTPAQDGMRIERQNAYPSAALDVFGATDFFFPRGMDHHTLFTGAPRAVHAVMQKIARQLAGLGRLPDDRPLEVPPATTRSVEVAVIGGGPAGLAAATELARAGRQVVLFDERAQAGGSLRVDPRHGPAEAEAWTARARAAGVELVSGATALGWYPEDRAPGASAPGLLAVGGTDGLVLVVPRRTVYATGSYEQNALFADNDRPGILAARAVGRLLLEEGRAPARRIVVLGDGPYARALADALAAAGAEVTRVDGIDERVTGSDGRTRLRALRVTRGGRTRRVRCDLLAVAALPAPATELLREHGAQVAWDDARGGFHVSTDAAGRTSVPGVYAAGDVAGFVGAAGALEAGARVGRAIAEEG